MRAALAYLRADLVLELGEPLVAEARQWDVWVLSHLADPARTVAVPAELASCDGWLSPPTRAMAQ